MSELSLKSYFEIIGSPSAMGVRYSYGAGNISLRDMISSVSISIYNKWMSLGGPNGRLGDRRGIQQKLSSNNNILIIQDFEHGSIVDFGNGLTSAALRNGALLPETPYRVSVEKITCHQKTQGEALEGPNDEVWARFVLLTNNPATPDTPTIYLSDCQQGGISSNNTYPVPNHVIYEGRLPELFNLTMLAVEVDYDPDAQELMQEYLTRVTQELGVWFTPGNSEAETILTFNLYANRIIASIIMGFADFWSRVITSVIAPLMELLIQGLQNWYQSELLGALAIPVLGEDLRKMASGELPGEEPMHEVSVYGYPNAPALYTKIKYSRDSDGSILEERRFIGGKGDADYTFTLRHWLGNNSQGTAPDRPIALTLTTNYMYIYNDNSGRSRFSRSDNLLSFAGDPNEYGYFLEYSLNGAPFVQITSLKNNSGTRPVTYTHIQLPEQESISYRVRAYNQSGFGPYSNTVVSDLPVPNPPYGLSASKASAGSGSYNIHVYWMDDCTETIGYSLERSRQDGVFKEVAWINAHNPSTRGGNHIDNVIQSYVGEKISYRLRSLNEYGKSAYSQTLEVII